MKKTKTRTTPRRRFARLIAIVLCVLLIGSTIGYAMMTLARAEEDSGGIQMEITLEEAAGGAHVSQAVFFLNDTGYDLTRIPFSLPANALRRVDTVPVDEEDLENLYRTAGFQVGGVAIESIRVNGEKVHWGLSGEGESILWVLWNLAPGEGCKIEFVYDLLLPLAGGFLGMDQNGWRLSGFSPTPGIFNAAIEDFDLVEPGMAGGFPYAKPTDYRVVIDAPESFVVAPGGLVTSQEVLQGRRRMEITSHGVREFAFCVSRNFHEVAEDGLRAFALTEKNARRVLEIAVPALSTLTNFLKDAPREEICFAQCGLQLETQVHGSLIFLDDDLFLRGNEEKLEWEIVWSIASWYFSSCVGHHPTREAWLGEATAAYAALLCYEERYGTERFLQELNNLCLPALNMTIPGGVGVDSEAAVFENRREYLAVVRARGAAVLHEIRSVVGRDRLIEALSLYVRQNDGSIASISDFAAALNEASGRELDNFLMEMLHNIGDYVNQQMEWYE